MNRRSFFSLLAAPVVAPMVPDRVDTGWHNQDVCTMTLSKTVTVSTSAWPVIDAETAKSIIDAINKEVREGSSLLMATQLKK